MTLQALEEELSMLKDAVRLQPQHALLPYQRRHVVYKRLGSIREGQGYQRRVWLDISATRRVLPLWRQIRPQDRRAEELLVLATDLLERRADAQAAKEIAKELWNWFVNRTGGEQYVGEVERDPRALNVMMAAVRTLFVATTPEITDWELEDEDFVDATDSDIDPWSYDTAGWAANAYAGPVWKPESDQQKRLEFWTWWLAEAVPAAWRAVPEPGMP